MKGFILTAQGIVSPEWIDRNGHMNITSYMALFDQGTDILFQKFGLAVSETDSDITMVAGRIYIEHRKELLEVAKSGNCGQVLPQYAPHL